MPLDTYQPLINKSINHGPGHYWLMLLIHAQLLIGSYFTFENVCLDFKIYGHPDY